MKVLIGVIVSILIIVAALSFTKDVIIKTSFEKGIELVTGLKVGVKSFIVGIFRPVVDIKELKVFNPDGFKDKLMLDMPTIYVRYDIGSFFKNKVHLNEVKIDLKEFVVVKNEKGILNLDSLKKAQETNKPAKKSQDKKQEEKAGQAPEIQIDKLDLKVGKVVYKDYSLGGTPQIQEINVNIDEHFENIDNPFSLVSIITIKALMNTSIANLANFDINSLSGTIDNAVLKAQVLGDSTKIKAVTENIKKQVSVLQDTLNTTTTSGQSSTQETVKKTTQALSGLLGSIGSSETK